MPSYVLDKAYNVEAAEGLTAGRVVVQGTNDEQCDLPSGANAGSILGVTVHGAENGRRIAVRKMGIAAAVAAGAINAGDPVCAADNEGRIKSAAKATAGSGLEGSNNAISWTAKKSGIAGNGITVDIVVSGTDASLSVAVSGNTITINSATDGGGSATTTAEEAIEAVQNDAAASLLVSGANTGSSDGSGAVSDETVTLSGGEQGENAFGAAEFSSSSAGDIIDVFLSL